MRRTFALNADALDELASEDLGRQSLADLAGVEWVLTNFGRDDPAPNGVKVTLTFAAGRIAGTSGCNHYSGNVTPGDTPGTLVINMPLASTMMACPSPADEIEKRFLETLQSVTQYSFRAGNLALGWRRNNQFGTMTFASSQPANQQTSFSTPGR